MKATSLFERFEAKVEKADGCWLWRGGTNEHGYGLFWLLGGMRKAHRIAYELYVGPIPEGLTIDHLCRTPACVNPDHLEPVTMRENTLRGISPAAQRARQTHCKYGHEFTPENTMLSHGKWRSCRECGRARGRAHYAANREQIKARMQSRGTKTG